MGILAGALLASRVEVFGEVPPVVVRMPDAGLTLVVNPAYVDAPFEQVLSTPFGAHWQSFSSNIEFRNPGDPPKHLARGDGALPPRFEILPGKPGFHPVPPFVAVPADGASHAFGVDSPATNP